MTDDGHDAVPAPALPEIDDSGVDLAQVRAMLDLSPAERLARVTSFLNSLLELRALNERSSAP